MALLSLGRQAKPYKILILPPCYPSSISSPTVQEVTLSPNPTLVALVTAHHVMSEFPTVFDKQIRSMQGKQFQISLTEDVKPFWVRPFWVSTS